jgi:polyhydroxyalkanoate synthesis repressor PhaR
MLRCVKIDFAAQHDGRRRGAPPVGIAGAMPVIRKYENRRLYDTSASRYVNLDEVAALVRAGEEVTVEDAKSGRDLTREVLLQVILEAPGGADLLPVGMLRRVIRATGDDPLQRILRQQLSLGLELLHGQLDQAESHLAKLGPTRKKADAAAEDRAAGGRPPEDRAPEGRAPEGRASEGRAPAHDPLDDLRARLADLEARLKR